MINSVGFLLVFAIALVAGLDVDWQSWFWGTAFGVSVAQIILPQLRGDKP